MSRPLKAVFLVMAVILITLALLPLQLIALALKLKLAGAIPKWWHKSVCRLIGIRVNTVGTLSRNRPLLLVANHVSWSDILVFGSIAELSFIAKHEVASLPGIKWLSRLQRSVFVQRERRSNSRQQAEEITQRLVTGDVIVLFSEGTTGSGNTVLPFNSSLLGSAQYALGHGDLEHVYVQPASICYTDLHGLPLGRRGRAIASWEGDQELWPHLSRFIMKGAWDVEVHFEKPIEFTADMKRRVVNDLAHKKVKKMLANSISVQSASALMDT